MPNQPKYRVYLNRETNMFTIEHSSQVYGTVEASFFTRKRAREYIQVRREASTNWVVNLSDFDDPIIFKHGNGDGPLPERYVMFPEREIAEAFVAGIETGSAWKED